MNFSLLGTEGIKDQPIVPADYPYTSHRTENFQPATPESVAIHRLRANARAWVGRADPGRALRPQEQRDDDYALAPGYYASRSFYHPRDKIPCLADATTYIDTERKVNPNSPHRQSYPLYGDGSIFPFTDKYQENFSECPAHLSPTSNTPATQQWPAYQNINKYDYDQQAREHLQRASNRLAFHASKGPNNHARERLNILGTQKRPARVVDRRLYLGPSVPGSVLPGRRGEQDTTDYRLYTNPNYGCRRPFTSPVPFTEGRLSRVENANSYKEKLIQPTHTRPHYVR